MDVQTMSILVFGIMGFFLLLGFPIAISILLSSSITFIISGVSLSMIMMKMISGANNTLLTAIPMFILAGALMNMGGITQRILNCAALFFGHIRGALGHVTIAASMVFAGISGSSVAETASIGSIVIPEMVRKKYPPEIAGGITCVAGTIGIIIPPSIPMVLFAMVTETSVGKLFLGGAIPGVLIGLLMMLVTYFIAKKHGYGKEREKRASLREISVGMRDGILALIMPFIIIGGIVGGVVTATEAAVLAVVYAFCLGRFVYKEIKLSELPRAFIETIRSTAVVMFVVAASSAFGWILAYCQIPQLISRVMLSLSDNRAIILIIINFIYLFAGCVSDVAPNIIILTPIFMPTILKLGIDPVHFGVVVTVNMAIGLVTPPVGNCLFIASNLSKVRIEPLFKAALPFLVCELIVLAVITFVPEVVMLLPKLLMK